MTAHTLEMFVNCPEGCRTYVSPRPWPGPESQKRLESDFLDLQSYRMERVFVKNTIRVDRNHHIHPLTVEPYISAASDNLR